MALILNIETAIENASICLAENNRVLGFVTNEKQKDHAAWLHPAIELMMKRVKMDLQQLDAIAVSIGPGSYTGLRIGLATAKGFCYALRKPLVTINTLVIMANAVKDDRADIICPMIDARRMEVFTALLDTDLQIIVGPKAMILDENSFAEELATQTILFFGNGSDKFKEICRSDHAIFAPISFDAATMVSLSEKQFQAKEFADLAYTEPLYLKEFFSPKRKPLI